MYLLKGKAKLAKMTLGWFLISGLLISNAFALETSKADLTQTVSTLNADFATIIPRNETKETIQWYTRFGSGVINGYLRDQSELNEETLEDICKLDRAFKTIPVRKVTTMTLYRGHDYLPQGADQVGYKFRDNAYTSTSLSQKVAMKFAMQGYIETRVLDIIEVDTRVIPAVWVNIFSAWDEQEFEVLLNRGVQFEVIDVKVKKEKGTTLTVRTLKALQIQRDSKLERTLNCH
jgi:hypothetical protein